MAVRKDAPAPCTPPNGTATRLWYGRWGASIPGGHTIPVLIILLLAGLLGLNAWLMARQPDPPYHALALQHTQLLEEQRVQTYLLSLPEAERPRLAMPPALRQRLRPAAPPPD